MWLVGLNWPYPRGLGKQYNKSGQSKSVKKSLKFQILRSIKVISVIEEVLNPKGDPIASTANIYSKSADFKATNIHFLIVLY